MSTSLDNFIQKISETEFPNTVETTQHLLEQQGNTYSELKEEILMAAKHGESLLHSIRDKSQYDDPTIIQSHNPDTTGNVFAVERYNLIFYTMSFDYNDS